MSFKASKKNVLIIITWILLVQVINLSIDPTDPAPYKPGKLTVCEDLTINEIESIYELVAEQCAGVNVPEQEDSDHHGSFVKVMAFFFTNTSIKIKKQFRDIQTVFSAPDDMLPSVDIELISPPPKLV